MGKITNALKKAADERVSRIEKVAKIQERKNVIVKKIGKSKVDPNIVTYFDQKALISEQYKILRTNLLSMNKGKPPKTVVFTSSVKNEGKTVTALNLAISLAQAVHKPKVLLIDADLRRGRIDKYLGVEQKNGLTEVLMGKCSVDEAMFSIDIDNLSFVTSGAVPENPAELLASDNMKNFVQDMKLNYDHIIIDSPPIIPVTDAGIVGAYGDGMLVVIKAGKTQRGVLQHSEELLNQAHTKILGYILTNIEYHLPEYLYRYL